MIRVACSLWVTLLAVHICTALSAETPATNAPIRDLGEGRLQIGAVTVDSKAKTVSFPATVNMVNGMVEYLVVTTKGKVHESLLRTEAEPFHIHTAMLLLGVTNATNAEAAAFFDPKRDIPGRRLKIEVEFRTEGANKAEIETFLAFAESKRPVAGDDIPHWIYSGSRFSDTPGLEPVAAGAPTRSGDESKLAQPVFMAQREGSIVSLIADPSALVNNPRKDRENDELWTLHTPAIPPVGTQAHVTFTLLP